MPVRILHDTVETIRRTIGASLLELNELDARRREVRQRLQDAFMALGDALIESSRMGTDGIEDIA